MPSDPCETNKQTVKNIYAALDEQDFDRLEALVAPDMALKPVGTDVTVPWEVATSELIPLYYGAFKGYHHVIDQLVAEDDWVVARITYHGTHTGDFMGAPATGNPMTYGGIHMLRIVDGKVVEFWLLEDDLGLMRQLGMDLFPVQEG
jgi:predicted ester cyclase